MIVSDAQEANLPRSRPQVPSAVATGPYQPLAASLDAAARSAGPAVRCVREIKAASNSHFADLSAVRCKRPNDRSSEAIPRRIGYEM